MTPRFSIVTVTLNSLRGLQRTAQSIRAQSFRDFEWIVVDGNSSDSTAKWLESSREAHLWISERDAGTYDAMNKGVLLASGDYIVFLNAGDELFNADTLAHLARALNEAHFAPDMLFCDALFSLQNGRSVLRPARQISYVKHGLPANHQATLFRKAAIQGTPYDLQYKICGDYFLVATMLAAGASSLALAQTVVRFEVGGKSFQSPKLLVTEAWAIQRNVIGVGFVGRLRSAISRSFATLALYLMNLKIWQRLRASHL